MSELKERYCGLLKLSIIDANNIINIHINTGGKILNSRFLIKINGLDVLLIALNRMKYPEIVKKIRTEIHPKLFRCEKFSFNVVEPHMWMEQTTKANIILDIVITNE